MTYNVFGDTLNLRQLSCFVLIVFFSSFSFNPVVIKDRSHEPFQLSLFSVVVAALSMC